MGGGPPAPAPRNPGKRDNAPEDPVGPLPLGVREDVKRPVALCCMFKANKMQEAIAKK